MKRTTSALLAGMTSLALAGPALASRPTAGSPEGLTAAQQARLAAGLQLAPRGAGATGPAPFVSFLPDLHKVDFAAWQQAVAKESQRVAHSPARRAAKARFATSSGVLTYREKEAATVLGRNDTTWTAEQVSAFGSAAGQRHRMVVNGVLAARKPPLRTLPKTPEDNGSIPLAADSGIRGSGRVTVSGVMGDGPFGKTTGDFDWYAVPVAAGETLSVEVTGASRDASAGIYSATGEVLAFGWSFISEPAFARIATYTSAVDATYYVQLGDSLSWQMDPFDSGSGTMANPRGTYTAEIGSYRHDRDGVLVHLRRGDVLGTSVTGAAKRVAVQRWDSQYVAGQEIDFSMFYPENSPLPSGGNAVSAFVAPADGWYGVLVDLGLGAYRNEVEVYRPGGEATPAAQTIFLDFDGATINTSQFQGGGPGINAKLSPMKAFLAKWGLKQSDLPALAAQITATATENLQQDLRRQGVPNLKVKVVNGLTAPDPFGRPNVSRVIVGGTIKESKIETVGIASAIDPGNFGREDSALVLLDLMSDPVAGNQSAVVSLNYYIRPTTDKIRFIGTAIGNVVSHEAGHYIGNFHTENSNSVSSLMDSGGMGFWRMFQAGPDRIGGTADDGDTDFTTDRFALLEGNRGVENTAVVSAWAFSAKVK